MRRQGQYGDPSANTYVAAEMHHGSGQRMETNSGNFEGRLEAFTPERENPSYPISKPEGPWKWEMDAVNMSNSMASRLFNEGQGGDASRSYFQGHRPDPMLALQNQSSNDGRSQAREEDMDVGYEGNHLSQTFEGLEQKFMDEIIDLAKELNDAEDSENARHREKIKAINARYEEKLAALRAQHASRRDEFLQRESHARQHQYQQTIRDPHPSSGMMPSHNPHGYGSVNTSAAAVGDVRRGYSGNQFDPYREQARFLGGTRDHGFEPRGAYPGGRVYDIGSRYYN
ncbi:uncharacterized protein LOC113853563 isoform X2 [Abrus precatorius]|uniref:Uncharacterized protein LOC113853563 isoform X2 n=1 Tax=Abrus precatorius TaxID=3816 RepID=A0A8B8K7T6_ABRPR|nr:uncharacterized protein LOC113853563 isoform X2 [Abrus precatorius]